MNHEERLQYQKEYRKRTNNSATYRYEKTPKGFLMRLYRNMKSRISGVQKKKHHLYQGKELLDKNTFYGWAENNQSFWKLYSKWIMSNYNRKFTPSVDRVNSNKGYSLDNMEWITHSENSRRGSVSRRYSPNSCENMRS